ncbi:AAA family ATPase [Roseofilum sp. Guam]|uniref:AAA family ATPase n=1 Tax=Roseofilum sp. Guam TaxID=2821502 RepID=UPI001B0192A6|nr:AAA family ATPase [Roseofilum sp. Guam]MBP0027621.1 AAA family ATPase [Roseofilum sp. Guam]
MLKLSQYQILATLSENVNTIVYRAVTQTDGTPVILKTIRKNHPSTVDIARLKHEYDIARHLDISGIVAPLTLDEFQEKPILVWEDFGGRDLAYWSHEKPLSVEWVLWVGRQLAETLGHLHQKRVIHKDIKPENIIFNPETQQLKLTDFSIASRLSKEAATISNSNLLEGTLTHISPEQTGRMNRAIDYRTDFYSLGITLYELLAGELPFKSNDPMELIHCHLAKTPQPLDSVNPQIPEILSGAIAKLMAKTAEDRYQSAYGIKADLEICWQQWRESQTVRPFILAQQDRRGTFSIPQKLYGRESEVRQLLAAFDRTSQGTTEMMLVAGYSGIGKSVLVNEVHKPIVRQRGYFVSGKFDQLQRHKPYSSLIQAFRELVRQLLAETEQQVTTWREKLTAALGKNGQAIVDVIPEVESIIGPQPALSVLSTSEAQNRFNLVFRAFIDVFTRQEHPLVMFLDDLQWADAASLQLIQLLVTNPDGQYLLVLGAYRDNEVSPTHPLIRTLSEIQEMGTNLETILLKPLDSTHITELVSDTIEMEQTEIESLTQLLVWKTRGNPFFLTQLFKYLYVEEVIKFNLKTGEWQWNAENLLDIEITENVVDLMVGEIEKLPLATQNILQLAACVGNRFDLRILAIVNEKSAKMVAADLWEALQSGLVVPLSDAYKIPQVVKDCETLQIDYKFLHDRVQQAAYSLIPEAEKQQVHLKVGRLLWQSIPPEQLDERIFDIVNPLNIGAALIVKPAERLDLARLNLQAGCKAKASNAYHSALEYLTTGRTLLPEGAWQSEYDLTLQLYTEAVEVEYLLARLDSAQSLSEVALDQARTLLDKVKIYELKIQFFIAQNQMLEAIETTLPVLELLGYPLETDAAQLQLVRSLPQLDELADYPEMCDPKLLSVLKILTLISGPVYQARPDLLPYVIYNIKNLCLEFGHSSLAAYAYGVILIPFDVDLTYQSGQISLRILEQYPSDALKCKVHMLFNCFTGHWKEPHQHGIKALEETVYMGLETGDVVYAAYSAMFSCGYMMLTGMTLTDVERAQQTYVDLLAKTKQDHAWYPAKTWRQLTQNLRGEAPNVQILEGEYLSHEEVTYIEASQNLMLLFFVYCAEVMLAYLMKDWQTAKTKIAIASQYQTAAFASMLAGGYVFYETLVQLAIYSGLPPEEQTTTWESIQTNTAQIANWASHAPHNYQSKHELILAEQARIQGRALEAMDYYDRAISTAQSNGFLAETGIAAERASEFYRSLGREKIAQHYLLDAIYGYDRWGALAKIAALENDFPTLYNSSPSHNITSRDTTGTYGQVLDFDTIFKANRVISGQIVLDRLLVELMHIILQNAGAQTGCLIVVNEDDLVIEASGSVDSEEIIALQNQPVAESNTVCHAIVNYVARTQESLVLNDASHSGNFTRDTYIKTNQPQSILCIPLVNQGKLISMVYLENNLTVRAFTDDRVNTLQVLSGQAAIALENAYLYRNLEQKVEERTAQLALANAEIKTLNEQLTSENLRLSSEVDVARKIQQMVLPKQTELEVVENLDIAGFMEPADEVGGDYYDILKQGDRIKISIGDVTGHGLESGVLMLMAQTVIRTLENIQETNAIHFLEIVNQTLHQNLQRMNSDKNMSLAILNYECGVIQVSGQHEEIIVVRADGQLELIDTLDLGFPIGLELEIGEFVAQQEIILNRDDIVILYTDGITEAENMENELYGLERLTQLAQQYRQHSAMQIRDLIIEEVRQFIGQQKVFDDITLVVLKQR